MSPIRKRYDSQSNRITETITPPAKYDAIDRPEALLAMQMLN
jgi:hypothetical protein